MKSKKQYIRPETQSLTDQLREKNVICPVMQSLIDQLKKRGIPLAESRMSDYHFHEFYFRVNASPETIKTLHIEGAKVVKNCIVCDCHWSTMEFKED